MGVNYVAISWNRQKRIYDAFIALGCVMYLSVFISVSIVFDPDITGETLLIRSTATLSVLLLHILLSIGPLCRLNKYFLPLLYNRRHLGVILFIVAAVHSIFSLLQFHSLGNVPALASLFSSNTRFDSWPEFPFQSLGFFALLILLLMAVTSHDFWLHTLTPAIWKALHMLVYIAYLLIVLHIILGVMQYETNPVFVIILGVGASMLIGLHLTAGLKEMKKDAVHHAMHKDGFVRVCEVDDIMEARAKIFCLQDESIAVYRSAGKLFAISNRCKHQNGPLGEGKIVNGCITCPWHGYQYLPENGCSPPPFKEKVSTYDVMITGSSVWLNPNAYPEGTERPGAVIAQ